ncbi:hypothetical protein DFH28DRAFT_959084, partial [Melampsora americana]
MSTQFDSHPIHDWLKSEFKSEHQHQPHSISIISTHLPFSFVFHISLNLLSIHPSHQPQQILIIIPNSQNDFNHQIHLEADAHLNNLDHQLSPLLEHLQFCFCDRLSSLIDLLNKLSKLSSDQVSVNSKVLSILILNPTFYISSESHLSNLTQILNLISLTQETISKHQTKPILIYLENLYPSLQTDLIHPETSLFKVFHHFSHSIWTIDQNLDKFILKSLSDQDQKLIKYEVLKVNDQDQPSVSGEFNLTKLL